MIKYLHIYPLRFVLFDHVSLEVVQTHLCKSLDVQN